MPALHEAQTEIQHEIAGRSIGHECGVIAVYLTVQGEAELLAEGISVAELAYKGLIAQQHRGPQSTGLAISNGDNTFSVIYGDGPADTAFENGDRLSELPSHGRIAVGQGRYTTSGERDDGSTATLPPFITGAQPAWLTLRDIQRGEIVLGHNGNLSNEHEIPEVSRGEQPSDSWKFLAHVAEEMDKGHNLEAALIRAAEISEGAWTIAASAEEELAVIRDPRGMRPGSIGIIGPIDKPWGWIIASETVAFDAIGATFLKGIKRGEVVVIKDDTGPREIPYASPTANKSAFCIMEDVYIASPNHRGVREKRINAGRRLAQEAPVKADLVVPVLDSGREYAQGYAAESGIPYEEAIRKVRKDRAFMGKKNERKGLVVGKHFIIPELVEGKIIVLPDDSLVRGDSLEVLVPGLLAVGAREVHVRIGSAPIEWPCFYGVDFPTRKELAMYDTTVEELRNRLGATSLHFLSLTGMKEIFERPSFEGHPISEKRCTACFDGSYPTDVTIPLKRLFDRVESPSTA